MNVTNERRIAARAKDLGESASAGALGELSALVRSESPLVRRLAASALGKQAGKKLLSLYAREKPRLREALLEKLARHARMPDQPANNAVERPQDAKQEDSPRLIPAIAASRPAR